MTNYIQLRLLQMPLSSFQPCESAISRLVRLWAFIRPLTVLIQSLRRSIHIYILGLQEYKAIRNAIIDKYRENPSKSLTFSEACSSLQGDADKMAAIWTFLDSWGIINYLAAQEPAEIDPLAAQATGRHKLV